MLPQVLDYLDGQSHDRIFVIVCHLRKAVRSGLWWLISRYDLGLHKVKKNLQTGYLGHGSFSSKVIVW